MPCAALSPRPPRARNLVRLLCACSLAGVSLLIGACSPLTPEASQIAAASSAALATLRTEHEALIRASGESERERLDQRFAALHAEAERIVRESHNLEPDDPIPPELLIDVSAVVIGLRDEALNGIAQTEASLLARSDRHHAHARRLTDALSAYLLARTESEALRRSLADAAARRIGIDPDDLTITLPTD